MQLSRTIPYMFLIVCTLFIGVNTSAQDRRSRTADGVYAEDVIAPITTSGWYVGGALGFNQFYGDMSDESFYKKFSGETKTTISLHLGKEITPWLALQLELVSGNLYALKDKFEDGRSASLKFEGNYFDIVAVAKIPLTRMIWPYSLTKFTGYLNGGLGLAFWNGNLYTQYNEDPLVPGVTNKKVGMVLPVGLGIQYDVSDHVSLFSELSYRINNDQVDGIEAGSSVDIPAVFKIGLNYHLSRLDYYKAPVKKKKRREVRETTKKKEGMLLFSKKKEEEQSYEYDGYDADKPTVMEYDKTIDIRKLMEAQKNEVKSIVTPQNIFEVHRQKPSQEIKVTPKPVVSKWEPSYGELVFRVQFLATGVRKNMTSLYSKYGSDKEIFEFYNGSIYKYSMGKFHTYNEALNYSRVMRDRGVYDAFIVVFQDGKQIRLTPEMKKY